MRRVFLLFFATVLLTVNVFAEGHLKFKGVEINGTYNEFIIALTKHGCQTIQNTEGTSICRGIYAGIEMSIIPQVTSQSKKVYGVVASSDVQKEWGAMNAQYYELKSLLTQKYGNGQYLQNLRDWYYISKDYKIERGNVRSPMLFKIDNGNVVLYMHSSASKEGDAGTLVVWYMDNANYEIKNQEANLDI